MFRRPPHPPPPAAPPLGIEDLEEVPRGPLVTPANALRAALLLAGGLAWGAAVRFADSLPVDMGFLAFALEVGAGLAFFLALVLLLLFRGFEVDRVMLVAAFVVGGAWVGLSIGPTVPPAVSVPGTYRFVPSMPAGLPASSGSLECQWANGRWRIGELRTISPIEGLPSAHQLTLDFLRRTMRLADGGGSTLIAVGNEAFAPPADAAERGEGDRTGTLDLLLLQVDPASTPSDANEVRGRFTWECPGPPAG